ncbi:hypothetical protein FJZ39_00785 [Candidatus Saccharibacteria bacterium]|nr:hypothetical protein [Candidatus Saccharibacteria bacterium]
MKQFHKIALSTVVGAVAGVVAGYLTAPQSGASTRTSIKDRARSLKKNGAQKVNAARSSVDKKVQSTRKK